MHMELAPSEMAELDEIGRELRAEGWAAHVTVERLLRDWKELAGSVDRYRLTVDDYTNDLTARDALEIVLARSEEPLRRKLAVLVEAADSEFRSRTVEDDAGVLARYFRVDDTSGWWWKRMPSSGALADELGRGS